MKKIIGALISLVACSVMIACNDSDKDDDGDMKVKNPDVVGFKITGMDVSKAAYIAMSDKGDRWHLVGINEDGESFEIIPTTNRDGKFEVDPWVPSGIHRLNDNYFLLSTDRNCGNKIGGKFLSDDGTVYAGGYILRKSDGRIFEISPSQITEGSDGYIRTSRKKDEEIYVAADQVLRFDDQFYFQGHLGNTAQSGLFRITLPRSSEPVVESVQGFSHLNAIRIAPNGYAFYGEENTPRIQDLFGDRKYLLEDWIYIKKNRVFDYDPSSGNWLHAYIDAPRNGTGQSHVVVRSLKMQPDNTIEYNQVAKGTFTAELDDSYLTVIAMDKRIYINICDTDPRGDNYAFGLYCINGPDLTSVSNTPVPIQSVGDCVGNRRILNLYGGDTFAIDDNGLAVNALMKLYDTGKAGAYVFQDTFFDSYGGYRAMALTDNSIGEYTVELVAESNGNLTETRRFEGYYFQIKKL